MNARKSVVKIASKLKTTARIIDYRIKQLMKNEVILGFKISINYGKLGIKFFKTFVYIDDIKKERFDELVSFLENRKMLFIRSRFWEIGIWSRNLKFYLMRSLAKF